MMMIGGWTCIVDLIENDCFKTMEGNTRACQCTIPLNLTVLNSVHDSRSPQRIPLVDFYRYTCCRSPTTIRNGSRVHVSRRHQWWNAAALAANRRGYIKTHDQDACNKQNAL